MDTNEYNDQSEQVLVGDICDCFNGFFVWFSLFGIREY